MIDILGTTYYMLSWGQTAYVVFMMFVLVISMIVQKTTRRFYITFIVFISSAGYGSKYILEDVYVTGNTVKHLCEKNSGLLTYQKEQARGFVSLDAISWKGYGFDYTEFALGNKKFRETYYGGKVARYEVKNYISKHVVLRKDSFVFKDKLKKVQYQVKNTTTNNILGELVYFEVYPGWLDSRIQEIVGFNFHPWICGNNNNLSYSDVIKATLIPAKSE